MRSGRWRDWTPSTPRPWTGPLTILIRRFASTRFARRRSQAPGARLSLPTIVALAGDPSIRVRLQAALALGERGPTDSTAVHALAGLATRDAADPWMRLAILSGLGESALSFVREWLSMRPDLLDAATPDQLRLLSEAAAIVGARRREQELVAMLGLVSTERAKRSEKRSDRHRIAGRSGRTGRGHGPVRSSAPCLAGRACEHRTARGSGAGSALDRPARRLALSAQRRRAPSDSPLRYWFAADPSWPCRSYASCSRPASRPGSSPRRPGPSGAWEEPNSHRGSSIRGASSRWARVVSCSAALLASPSSSAALVEAIEDQKSRHHRARPGQPRDASETLRIPWRRKRALAILARSAPADRSSVVARAIRPLSACPAMPPEAQGSSPRTARPATSIRARATGSGPDLSGIAGRPPAVLLSDILDPNRDVAPDFVALTVATHRGAVLSGLLAEETGSSLKLRKAEGIDETILRSEIAELRSSGRSLMPEGLEQTLTLQEMADLLAFLRSGAAVTTGK